MTKLKFTITAEVDGVEVTRSKPEFIFGFREKLKADQLDDLIRATAQEMVGVLQAGLRVNAPGNKIKVWPEEG
jgi:hypothetical protein